MKKILFITPFAPSNIGAAMKFTKKTIESLAETYIVDLVYFCAEGEQDYVPESKNIRVIERLVVGKKERMLSVLQKPWLYPIFSVRYRRGVEKNIKKLCQDEKYDLVFLDHSQSFIYGKLFPLLPKILMSHDVIYQRVSRTSGKLISTWCKLTEKKMLCQKNAFIYSFSTKDQTIIKEQYGFDSFVTSGNVDDLVLSVTPTYISNNFIFFGQWVRKDNSEGLEWFLDKVYPSINSGFSFKIIGRGLPDSLLEKIKDYNNIEYLGFVENPYQMITDARAVLSPLFSGAGVKFKVLESMACGTPVIGSEIAFEGIPTKYKDLMIQADTVEEYIRAMDNVNINIAERQSLRKFFIENYVKSQIVEHVKQIIE